MLETIMKRSLLWSAPKNKFNLVDGKVVEGVRLVVHRFKIYNGIDEDINIATAEELIKWEESEEGKWVTARTTETASWYVHDNPIQICIEVAVVATLPAQDATFWQLKWGDKLTGS